MSRVQLKRRKRREKGNLSIKSIICAAAGMVSLIVLVAAIYASVAGRAGRVMTGASMIFFFLSLWEMCFGIKYSRREGFTFASRLWGVLLPTAAFAGFAVLYVIGLLKVL